MGGRKVSGEHDDDKVTSLALQSFRGQSSMVMIVFHSAFDSLLSCDSFNFLVFLREQRRFAGGPHANFNKESICSSSFWCQKMMALPPWFTLVLFGFQTARGGIMSLFDATSTPQLCVSALVCTCAHACVACVCVTIVPCALMNRVVAQVSSSHLMFRMGPKTHSWSRSLLHMKRPVPPHVYHAQEGPFMSRNE